MQAETGIGTGKGIPVVIETGGFGEKKTWAIATERLRYGARPFLEFSQNQA